MPQKTKKMTLKRLRKLLEKCLILGPRWARVAADSPDPPTWKDVYQLTLNAYAMALEDVLKALNGNCKDLERTCPADPKRRSGRPFIVDPSKFPWRRRVNESQSDDASARETARPRFQITAASPLDESPPGEQSISFIPAATDTDSDKENQ